MNATRFAPSMTGYLHLGHVLHILYVWGVARATETKVVSRIEDHDRERARPEYETAILENLEWLGFVPDLGITTSDREQTSTYRQSDCVEYYAAILQTLEERELVYGCECSRKDIIGRQPASAVELCYSGTCADKQLPLDGNTVRFRVPKGEVVFKDLVLGECRQSPVDQCGDFSLRDRTGQWAYQFCCVCDDIRQGIDLVVRGEDILPSTARQIQLFQALEASPPTYFHHPLLKDEHGQKLSKRQCSESISQLREAGASFGEILGQAAYAGGLVLEMQELAVQEALDLISKAISLELP
jgi:glutamyl/glutaminyl-tRNA synthetase